jgi:ElaB/YqjD/DUF883 family membrane-anchored ribosome-binding protein
MAKRKTRKPSAKVTSIDDVRSQVKRLRSGVEDAVDTLRKRAVRALPASQRKQVDEVLDRISSVSHDVNKTVGHWRADIEKQYRVLRGTVDKRVNTIRKRASIPGTSLISNLETDVRKYVDGVFRRLQLPVHGDLETIKRRLNSIERRLSVLEKSESRAA